MATSAADATQEPTLRAEDITVTDPKVVKRAVTAAAVGNVTEWYDFGVYGYFVLTLQQVFFAGLSDTASLIATFAVFASSFLVRPLGGVIFGSLGDRIGRTKVLAMTVILMAVSTFSIGLVPSYDSIGIVAPILVLVAKLGQGLSTGGEYSGAMTFIAEYTSDKRRGFTGSFLEMGTFTGYSLGAATVAVLTAVMPQEELLSWGYRIPFLLALPLGMVGLFLRLRLEETPAFEQLLEQSAEQQHDTEPVGVRSVFVHHWRALLLCGGIVTTWNITNYMLTSFMPTYLADLPEYGLTGVNQTTAQFMQIAVLVMLLVLIPSFGWLSDRFGRRPILAVGATGLVLFSLPAVLLMRHGSTVLTFVGLLMIGLMLACFSGTAPSTLPALFPTEIRYSGLAISFNIFVSLFGGTTALVMSTLLSATKDLNWPGYYLIGAGVIGAISIALIHETNGKPLPGAAPAVSTEEEAHALVAAQR
ncbi:MFS transporter [Mycobacterium sp. 1274756.6]|uniref:MFS transporter n=1 Tax=Mycobacterium sp. 1274756.6 TaxID=1834076 RepID=UPI000B048CB7|nr:MFS transporter [Mycobacterium sp. 1274756.6]